MGNKIVNALFEKLQLSETNVLIALSIVVGLATGFGALGFIALIEYFNHIFFGLSDQILTQTVGRTGPSGYKFYLPLIPMVGGLLVGPIVFKFALEAKGHGVPEVMDAVARLGGIIRPRVAGAKAVASAICIGSGGSAGREGPIIQIGSAVGSTIGQMLHMSGDRVKILVGCGSAAGISAVFNAPLAGVLFAMEIILGDYAIRTFAPVLISSVISSVVIRAFLGNNPAFEVPSYSLVSAWEIPLYMVMGVVIGVVAVLFTRTLDVFEDYFDEMKIPNWTKPALGGLLLGIIAIFFPQILADGYQTIGLTLLGNISLFLMVILIFLKIAATSLTLGSGNSGGIFAPSLFAGAMTGGTFGIAINYLFPEVTATPGAYALVGMAAMVAGTTHAPMTAILIIYEMTLDYRIILPLMVCVVFSTLVARHLFAQSIYTVKLYKRGIDIRGGKDINVLRSHRVREVMSGEFETILAQTTLAEIFNKITHSMETHFVVTDSTGKLEGVISFQDIRNLLSQHELDYLVIAQDLVEPKPVVINDDDTLETAYSLFGQRDFGLIPVVQRHQRDHVVGVIRRETLVDYYNKQLIETLRY
jgi:CIC family chloride channel protein